MTLKEKQKRNKSKVLSRSVDESIRYISSKIKNKTFITLQQSWNFTNDSLQTTLCLQWEPEIIAISMIFLSAKLAKVDVLAASTKWWEKFIPDLSMELIESVCHSVLDIYQSSKKPKQKLFSKRKGLNYLKKQ